MWPKKRATCKIPSTHLWEMYLIHTTTCKTTSLAAFGLSRNSHGISQRIGRQTYIMGFAFYVLPWDSRKTFPTVLCISVQNPGLESRSGWKKHSELFPQKLPPQSTYCHVLLQTRSWDPPAGQSPTWAHPRYAFHLLQGQSSRRGVHGGDTDRLQLVLFLRALVLFSVNK